MRTRVRFSKIFHLPLICAPSNHGDGWLLEQARGVPPTSLRSSHGHLLAVFRPSTHPRPLFCGEVGESLNHHRHRLTIDFTRYPLHVGQTHTCRHRHLLIQSSAHCYSINIYIYLHVYHNIYTSEYVYLYLQMFFLHDICTRTLVLRYVKKN